MINEDDDDNIESLVTARSAGTENMEPGEYQAYVKTQIAKAIGFKEDTTNIISRFVLRSAVSGSQ
jgi:hypothetical protein